MKKYELLENVYKSNLPSRAKQIMFYLINRANAEGTCFPSVRTIASDCGISERTIQRTMKVLLEEEFVIKENRYRDNGGQSSNLYKLRIEAEKNIDNKSNSNEDKIKENDLSSDKQTAFNILEQKIAQDGNFTIKPKCWPIFIKYKTQKIYIYCGVTPSIFLWQGVGDNLYPP